MAEGSAALRDAAARWSLAGDQQLLDLLQEIHQRIISRCNETNQKLEEMSRGLRDASVNLQNVNNKFLALSNTQFVESRVYEDDADLAAPVGVEKDPPRPDLSSDLTKLKESLQILESYHEPLLIVGDSDESDSDDNDDRLVLKPKELYTDRPLPYIIGSQAWRNKWHAGLVPDDTDSDSSASKAEEPEVYSDSEDEPCLEDILQHAPNRKESHISSDNSSLQSDIPVSVSPVRPSPSAVAAELARRLGGDVKIPEREPVYNQPEPVARKLYKPQEPLATIIFPDEPPPLDEASSDDDIFAELHKNHPKNNRADDLFDFNPKPSELEDALFGAPKVQTNHRSDRPPLFADDEPEVTATPRLPSEQLPDDSIKKPVGGISLFGTNKHAESIGAAILKRNRRKSSTSGDESNTEEVKVVKEVTAKEVNEVKKERDIFDDLFAKSEKLNKKNAKTDVVQARDVAKPKEVKKKDVFSDIFDDIDDIFSSDVVNVKIKETKKDEKSLFSNDDDLFAEISKVSKSEVTATEKSDLFSDVTPKLDKVQAKDKDFNINVKPKEIKREVKKENKVLKEVKETKGLFDSDSDDGLFTKDVKPKVSKAEKPVEYKLKDNLFDDDDDDGLFAKASINSNIEVEGAKNIIKDSIVSKKALFDSDEELFKDNKTVNEVKPEDKNQNKNVVQNIKPDNQLFVTPVNKEPEKPDIIKEVQIENYALSKSMGQGSKSTLKDSINNDLFNDDTPEYPKESPLETSHDSFNDEEPYKSITNEIGAQNSDKFSSKSNELTFFQENILRTTRIGAEEDSIPAKTQDRDILNESDDNLFRSTSKVPSAREDSNKSDGVSKTIDLPDTPDLLETPSNKNDIFSDVFDDVPPIFEKPKEPKRSKNVNALFDDDSDDEALFFRKSDAITDEKPTFSPSGERFGIFNDEPPAIDIDFTHKSSKHEEVTKKSPNLDKTDNLANKSDTYDSVTKKPDTDALISKETQDTTDNTSKEHKKIGKLKPMNFNINVNTLLPGASPKKKQVEGFEVHTASNEELHKADKIEPKIVKSISFDDPEILDNKISKERAKIQVKRRPSTRRARKEAVRKSAIDFTDSSFDSSNDNCTKEEVKEKIVKTVYILNDDDIFGTPNTYNENSDTKKHLNIVDSDEELFKSSNPTDKNDNVNTTNDNASQQAIERKVDANENNDILKEPAKSNDNDEIDATVNKVLKAETELDSNENDLLQVKNTDNIKQESPKEEFTKKTEPKSFLDSDDSDDLFRQAKKPSTILDRTNEPYLDSDDELFKNPPKNKINDKAPKSFLSSDDDDDLFKTKSTNIKPAFKSNTISDDDQYKNKGIGTLGKVYNKTDTKAKETHSIFDDFPAKSNVTEDFNPDKIDQSKNNATVKEQIVDKTVKDIVNKPAVKKSILDDSSDEEDLFKSKTKILSRNNKSLFGDDGDDDDLFGSKPVKEVKQDTPVALPTKEPKAAEPVFVDPLSLFGDEE